MDFGGHAGAPRPRVQSFAETDVAAGFRRDENHARIATRGIEREQARLTYRVVDGVDAQEGTAHVRHVSVARPVAVVLLPKTTTKNRQREREKKKNNKGGHRFSAM